MEKKSFQLGVKVIPNASRDEIIGWHNELLKIKTAAQPESGKANKAVCQLLAKQLGLPKKAVYVLRGGTIQTKTVKIDGASGDDVLLKLPRKTSL
ncbi:DUF167 domain-containing protein [Luteolibacter algae]|uniref:UPF0235 protein ACFSSA_08550 n=1 Tax=Luteolibacter algae TaxID=454151 RepID=A0ABW5D6J1_9BACT